ncbi:MAG: hypothetical protein FWD49_01170 [Firmicutes bacterium]|nr:hypothetical protein [Bacillota bacterium]
MQLPRTIAEKCADTADKWGERAFNGGMAMAKQNRGSTADCREPARNARRSMADSGARARNLQIVPHICSGKRLGQIWHNAREISNICRMFHVKQWLR